MSVWHIRHIRVCLLCVYACLRVCRCACVYARVCVRARVCAHMCVLFARVWVIRGRGLAMAVFRWILGCGGHGVVLVGGCVPCTDSRHV